jgi:HEPN domain-containing protein
LSDVSFELPIASREAAELALEFSHFANMDLRAAETVFRQKLPGVSLYHLQQAVEKASKGFGVLVGASELDLTKLAKEIGHTPLSMLFARSSAVLLSAVETMSNVVQLGSSVGAGVVVGASAVRSVERLIVQTTLRFCSGLQSSDVK